MREQNYDRLEQFFRKAADKGNVAFNEEDWKKLESRLDAAGVPAPSKPENYGKVLVTGMLLVTSLLFWVGTGGRQDDSSLNDIQTMSVNPAEEQIAEQKISETVPGPVNVEREQHSNGDQTPDKAGIIESLPITEPIQEVSTREAVRGNLWRRPVDSKQVVDMSTSDQTLYLETPISNDPIVERDRIPGAQEESATVNLSGLAAAPEVDPEKYKQKAIELPGAEEEQNDEAQAVVQKEHASDNMEHATAPKLSLLLSFAPDFSGTSMLPSSSPGKAYGAMIEYQFLPRWSLGAGVINNHKQYTGPGEDYQPPKGYWDRYTNGVVPKTIDGSCSVVEFPIMIQYTPAYRGKNRWNFGAGVSSYLMRSEAYEYNFDQPNTGARTRWDSRSSSQFLFNMINFSIGYERQVAPGLMIGIEPYAKIPLEEIGWSNIKLFSSGASFTLRYTILAARPPQSASRSRGQD